MRDGWIRAPDDLRGQSAGEARRASLVETRRHPQAGRFDELDHRLAGDDRRAGLGIASNDDARCWRDEPNVGALPAQCIAFGTQACDLLSRACEVRFGSLHGSQCRIPFLQARLDRAGADELLLAELDIALRIDLGEFPARLRVAQVSFDSIPDGLSVGEMAEVTLVLEPGKPTVVVPNAAIQRRADEVGAWVVVDGRLRFSPLRTGVAGLDGRVQVLDGLKAGQQIVVHAEQALSERSRIRIVDALSSRAP
jgi:hypothetical protein